MTAVFGVWFQPHGTLHLLRSGPVAAGVGDAVLYPTEGGPAVATVVWAGEVADASGVPQCSGQASADDVTGAEAERGRRAEIEAVARTLITRHGLPMKVLAVDHQQPETGQSLAVVYYESPVRVDFRGLLPDLGRALACRVDLRQVGDRDAARLFSAVGSCGRQTCCTSCLVELEPVVGPRGRNPHAASTGSCGRAMCCLSYHPSSPAEERRATQ